MTGRTGNRIELGYDGCKYVFEDVDQLKYENWVKARRRQRDTETFRAPALPYQLQVEPTSLCNLRCPLCPAGLRTMTRKTGHMPLELFESLVDDMAPYLLLLVLWEWGEPLLNPAFPDMVRAATERGIRTITSTNAHFFADEDYVVRLLRSGLSTIIVAVDSLDQKSYERYRQGGNLSRALTGLSNLVRLKRQLRSPTEVNLRMVVTRHTEHELDAMRAFARRAKVDRLSAMLRKS